MELSHEIFTKIQSGLFQTYKPNCGKMSYFANFRIPPHTMTSKI